MAGEKVAETARREYYATLIRRVNEELFFLRRSVGFAESKSAVQDELVREVVREAARALRA